MPLTLAQLEEMREECMAEDIEIDMSTMASWSEERARTYFENGGEDENEVSAWLRENNLLTIETAFRYHFETLDAIKSRVQSALDDEGDIASGPHAANIAIGKVVGSLKLDLSVENRARLRTVLRLLCGFEVSADAKKALGGMGAAADVATSASTAPVSTAPVGAAGAAEAKWREPPHAAIAHSLPGAMPLPAGKKVLFRMLDTEPQLNGAVGEVMAGPDEPSMGGKYCVKVMHGVSGQAVTGRAQNNATTLRYVLPGQIMLHPDQLEKDRLASSENAIVLLGGDDAEREARAALYSMRLDPQHWCDTQGPSGLLPERPAMVPAHPPPAPSASPPCRPLSLPVTTFSCRPLWLPVTTVSCRPQVRRGRRAHPRGASRV